MRVAIAHEWLTRFGGAEATLKSMLEVFPDATVYCAVADPKAVARCLPGVDVRPLLSSKLPLLSSKWPYYAPAIIAAWSRVKIDADLLVISNYFAAHGAARGCQGRSIGYYHTPMRVAWSPAVEKDRMGSLGKPILAAARPALRRMDRASSTHVDAMLANSHYIKDLIQTSYGREAEVLYPPVDVKDFSTVVRSETPKHFLCLGRLVAYKRMDLAVQACTEANLPLVVVGEGPELANLRAMAGPTITFTGAVSRERLKELMAEARALIFPGIEDFGLVPVEAAAAGVPVVALREGGAVESLSEMAAVTWITDQTVRAVRAALESADLPLEVSERERVAIAERFGPDTFKRGLERVVHATAT